MSNEVFVLGSTGQVGGEIKRLFPSAVFPSRDEIDLANPETITDFFKNRKASLIVNCAAFTQVDLAETNRDLVYQVNAASPELLAKFCERFIHFSTDYVFNGQNFKPYIESDITAPLNEYGKSKLDGENRIFAANPNSVIIRTSWVYSDIGKNFVKTMLRLGKEKNELSVVWDQIGSPTYAYDLADVVVNHGLKKWNFKNGIYHFTNEGVASWYDFAREVFDIKGVKCKVNPIRSEEYPTPAQRPHYSILDKAKIKNELGIVIPHWKESLKICLQKLS